MENIRENTENQSQLLGRVDSATNLSMSPLVSGSLSFQVGESATKIQRSLILKFVNADQLDTFAIYLLMRHRFKRRKIFYNYTRASVAKELGIHRNTAARYIKRLIEFGLLDITGKNLIIKSPRNFVRAEEKCIPIILGNTKKEQVAYLRLALLSYNIKRQEKKAAKKTAILKKYTRNSRAIKKSEYRLIEKAGGIENFEKSICTRTHLSNNKAGKMIGRSKYTGARFKKFFKSSGMLSCKSEFEVVKENVTKLEYFHKYSWRSGYLYSDRKSSVVKRTTDTITILYAVLSDTRYT